MVLYCLADRCCLCGNRGPQWTEKKQKGKGQGCSARDVNRQVVCFSFFCHSVLPLSLWLSLSLTLDWWNCQWFITNVSGRHSRLLFCPCQSQVEPEVGSFAYQSKPISSPPPPLSLQSSLDRQLSRPRAKMVVMEIALYGGAETETKRKWHTFHIYLLRWEQCLFWSLSGWFYWIQPPNI